MKTTSSVLFFSLLLASCINGTAPKQTETPVDTLPVEQQASADVKSNTTQAASEQMTEPTEDQILLLLRNIPDHRVIKGSEQYMTKEYSDVLREAWSIPSDALDGIGSDEFLYYFMTGNGGACGLLVNKKNVKMEGNKCDIDLSLAQLWVKNDECDKLTITFDNGVKQKYEVSKPEMKQLNLVFENGQWLINDFYGTKQQMKEYIENQQKYFASKEWVDDYTSAIKDAEASKNENWKKDIMNKVATTQHYLDSVKVAKSK